MTQAGSPDQPRHGPQRLDCVAGVGGLELRNVDANYLFERSHRFAGIQPNSGFGDYSRLSCVAGIRSSGPVDRTLVFRSSISLVEMARVAAISADPKRAIAPAPRAATREPRRGAA